MDKAPTSWAVQQALIIARATLQRMEATGTVDTDEAALLTVLRDEGADVEALLVALVRAIGEAGTSAASAKVRAAVLKDRADRYERQVQEYRSAINAIMDTLGTRSFRHPEFTLTVTAGRPGVVVTDSEAIPDAFVRITRTPDKVAIGAALASGATVPGAEMRNGADTLTVRTR